MLIWGKASELRPTAFILRSFLSMVICHLFVQPSIVEPLDGQ